MNRRDVVQAGGATLVVALAGCATESSRENQSTTTEEVTTATTETTTTTTTTTETSRTTETTTTTTTVAPAKTRYDLGGAHVHDQWTIRVTDFELTPTFQTDDGGTYEMPPETQLGVATVEVTNQASGKRAWAARPFAVIFEGEAYQEQTGFEHPEFANNVAMDELKRIEHMRQFAPQAYPVESGETVTLWALFVLPADVSRTETSVGFDGESGDGATYPARWEVQ